MVTTTRETHPTRENKEPEEKKRAQPSEKRNGDIPLGYSGRTALRREQCNMYS
jgi:hypothetical protein